MNDEQKTILVERTSKRLKMQTLLSILTLLAGIVLTLLGATAENASPVILTAGVVGILCGLVWLAVTKCRVWWNHQ